jgi:hypothetical protein
MKYAQSGTPKVKKPSTKRSNSRLFREYPDALKRSAKVGAMPRHLDVHQMQLCPAAENIAID